MNKKQELNDEKLERVSGGYRTECGDDGVTRIFPDWDDEQLSVSTGPNSPYLCIEYQLAFSDDGDPIGWNYVAHLRSGGTEDGYSDFIKLEPGQSVRAHRGSSLSNALSV